MIRAFVSPCGKTHEEQHKAAYELLYAAASFLGLSVGRIEKTEDGKPYFPDTPSIHFSIAHAEGMAAVAIGDGKCGIDIEGDREVSERIRKKYFDEVPECKALIRWTERESYGKYEGSGFFAPPPREGEIAFKTFTVNEYTVTVCADKHESIVLIDRF